MLAAILAELLPDAFKPKALSCASIICGCNELSPEGEEHKAFKAAKNTVGLARWLTGFDAATENSFYDFSASGVRAEVPMISFALPKARLLFGLKPEFAYQHGDRLAHVRPSGGLPVGMNG